MVLGLIFNLGVLGYFKYANFGVSQFNAIVAVLGFSSVPWSQIVLPIGLSFYVLQSVSYLVDVHRGTVPISRSFLNYAAYKAIFCQLIAGPIVRYAEIADELKSRKQTLQQFGAGARLFMIGFAMKVIFGDTLSPVVDAVFALPKPAFQEAWTGALAYTLQLYFDFAGYSLLAIGLALMMGFHFPRNFNNPYLADSIQNFWQRWHMTLSRFLRDYLYIPFGGNRHGTFRTYLNLLLVMVIGGAWHGASWNFIVWGAWHGGWLALHRWWSRDLAGAKTRSPMPWLAANLLTMLIVVIGWVVFRAHDLHGAMDVYGGMLGLNGFGFSDALIWQITPDRWWCIPIGIVMVYLPLLHERRPQLRSMVIAGKGILLRTAFGLWLVGPVVAFALGIVLLYSRDAVPFLYFQF
jgi:alginate O-acetyltransferase complex protein AlgI